MGMIMFKMVKSILNEAGLPEKAVASFTGLMSDYLKELGYTKWQQLENNKRRTVATERGRQIGITTEKACNDKGEEFEVLLFPEEIKSILTSKIGDFEVKLKDKLDSINNNGMKITEMVREILKEANIPDTELMNFRDVMSDYLKELGYTEWKQLDNGKRATIVTDKGKENGIFVQNSSEKRGDVLLYPEAIKKMLASNIREFAEEVEELVKKKKHAYYVYKTSQAFTLYRKII